MAEWLDILDENGTPIGVKEREAVHRDGNWHRTFDCWVIDRRRPAVLFQCRSLTKSENPGLLDTSAAGHLRAGETWRDGVRELEEELGLVVPPHALVPLGVRVKSARYGSRIDNEFQEVFLTGIDRNTVRLTPGPEEVAALAWIGLEEGLAFFSGRCPTVRAEWWEVGVRPRWRELPPAAFVPAVDRYYLKVFIMAERWLAGKAELAI
ncbi:MAG: NUDIX domain-containing protein [Firmicutes bacterium]|nr:NUDIX domain-containing protein [Alicyclobacillaceae bacterium]MCL6498266.1 NUDIX domain-containing protein [Bacillota bacterium]